MAVGRDVGFYIDALRVPSEEQPKSLDSRTTKGSEFLLKKCRTLKDSSGVPLGERFLNSLRYIGFYMGPLRVLRGTAKKPLRV